MLYYVGFHYLSRIIKNEDLMWYQISDLKVIHKFIQIFDAFDSNAISQSAYVTGQCLRKGTFSCNLRNKI